MISECFIFVVVLLMLFMSCLFNSGYMLLNVTGLGVSYMSKLSPEDKVIIAKRKATGESQTSIAKDYNVSQAAISKCLSSSEQRALVKSESSKIVAALPDIVGKWLSEIKSSKDLAQHLLSPDSIKNETMLESVDEIMSFLRYVQSNEKDLLKSMGIIPSQTLNLNFQQVINDNRKTVIDTDVLKFMGLSFEDSKESSNSVDDSAPNKQTDSGSIDDDVIDADYTVIDE